MVTSALSPLDVGTVTVCGSQLCRDALGVRRGDGGLTDHRRQGAIDI